MILHPAIIALLMASSLTGLMVVYAAFQGLLILRSWDLSSGSELQLSLERRTYLISTILGYALAFQLASLFLYVLTVDRLCTLFTGAMCAAGTLNVNAWGYPALLLKIVGFLLAGVWLILNYADNRACDYPLIKTKYRLLLVLAPLMVVEAALLFAYFLGLKADVITSCCGSLFSERSASIASEIAAFPAVPMMIAFFASLAGVFVSGGYYLATGRGGYLFSAAAGTGSLIAVFSVLSFLSLYVYELPTHHCPFCILHGEYGYVGYPLYAALLGGGVSGVGVGALTPFRTIESLRGVLPGLQSRLCRVALCCFAVLTAIAAYTILASNLSLQGLRPIS